MSHFLPQKSRRDTTRSIVMPESPWFFYLSTLGMHKQKAHANLIIVALAYAMYTSNDRVGAL